MTSSYFYTVIAVRDCVQDDKPPLIETKYTPSLQGALKFCIEEIIKQENLWSQYYGDEEIEQIYDKYKNYFNYRSRKEPIPQEWYKRESEKDLYSISTVEELKVAITKLKLRSIVMKEALDGMYDNYRNSFSLIVQKLTFSNVEIRQDEIFHYAYLTS